jgi:hypothetical protein
VSGLLTGRKALESCPEMAASEVIACYSQVDVKCVKANSQLLEHTCCLTVIG